MLIHNKCGNKVLLDLTSAVKFTSGFGLTPKGLVVNMVTMLRLGNSGESAFVCGDCNVSVPTEDLGVICNYCGTIISVARAKLPKLSGGVVCEECAKTFYNNEVVPLNVKTFSITKDALR